MFQYEIVVGKTHQASDVYSVSFVRTHASRFYLPSQAHHMLITDMLAPELATCMRRPYACAQTRPMARISTRPVPLLTRMG